ncbi:hypothetical protein CPU12_09690 [Malaciobacter molluscorum LMG 25693]|uniref:Membrane protein n=1 Tax=Malaciobacter molluscorum LMG 25693 TaxID=870501 RepID=A0A2G1DGI6_9BACT|nr:hypothetical protein [Malaciobacter molluscorum]AXX91474.1 putative membrane protein [Malaciobacter molluscorum LMG 25693]PHO17560.1 hypothetical protein CPU12_09690 [Malaciobacter molluscorum LMG 25693]RXJ93373.1 hypothetical protein CRV00_11360 [Malaciobacter molluscorum]
MNILRFVNAVFIGYLISALSTVTLSLTLPFSNKTESILLASMLSFIIWLVVILYSYSTQNIKKLFLILITICFILFVLNNYVFGIKG